MNQLVPILYELEVVSNRNLDPFQVAELSLQRLGLKVKKSTKNELFIYDKNSKWKFIIYYYRSTGIFELIDVDKSKIIIYSKNIQDLLKYVKKWNSFKNLSELEVVSNRVNYKTVFQLWDYLSENVFHKRIDLAQEFGEILDHYGFYSYNYRGTHKNTGKEWLESLSQQHLVEIYRILVRMKQESKDEI